MLHRESCRRAGMSTTQIVLIVAGVLGGGLLVFCIVGGLLLTGVSKARDTAKRMECTNNLRNIGIAMLNQESAGRYPSEVLKAEAPSEKVSFYTLILEELEYSKPATEAMPGGTTNRNIKTFLCPSRRSPQQAPGKRDYGYVTFGSGGAGGQAILDFPEGASLNKVAEKSDLKTIAVLSHLWMNPQHYLAGDPTDVGWSARPPQNARTQAQPFEDSNTEQGSTSCMGSPHSSVMPVLFLDGHVTNLSYTGFGAENWTNIWNINNKTPIVFPQP